MSGPNATTGSPLPLPGLLQNFNVSIFFAVITGIAIGATLFGRLGGSVGVSTPAENNCALECRNAPYSLYY